MGYHAQHMNPNAQNTLLLTCSTGCSPSLEKELTNLGFACSNVTDTAIETAGTFDQALQLNLEIRSAQRVCLLLESFEASSLDQLYDGVHEQPWEAWLKEGSPLTLTSAVYAPGINDPRIVTLKAKDAIVDRLRDKRGQRPDSGSSREGAVIHVYWSNFTVRLYLDTSGAPLGRRGYRLVSGKAPMQEPLAAACVLSTGWDRTTPFLNPMCGSGTLAIEAAMLAADIPPGSLRDNFGFMHSTWYNADRWNELRQQAVAKAHPPRAKIYASDMAKKMLAAARENAQRAGVESYIAFEKCDFSESPVPPAPGIVMMNPEYGFRIGEDKDLVAHYRAIGDFLKQRCTGYTGYVFTGNRQMAKELGLKTSRRMIFYNSQVECRLLEFELYTGTRDP